MLLNNESVLFNLGLQNKCRSSDHALYLADYLMDECHNLG